MPTDRICAKPLLPGRTSNIGEKAKAAKRHQAVAMAISEDVHAPHEFPTVKESGGPRSKVILIFSRHSGVPYRLSCPRDMLFRPDWFDIDLQASCLPSCFMGLPSLAFWGKSWLFQIKVTSEDVERSPFKTWGA